MNKTRVDKYGFTLDCKTCFRNKKGKYIFYKWYKVWRNMRDRCYNPKDKAYIHYGENGVYVSEELKIASIFRDWYNENNPTGELVMDKDIVCEKYNIVPKYYGKNTVTFISMRDNTKEMINRKLLDEDFKNSLLNRLNINRKKGCENPLSKPKEYYAHKGTKRSDFRKICKRQGWDINDFLEIDSGESYLNKKGKATNKKYFYIYQSKLE